jgi:hypothetical protein
MLELKKAKVQESQKRQVSRHWMISKGYVSLLDRNLILVNSFKGMCRSIRKNDKL